MSRFRYDLETEVNDGDDPGGAGFGRPARLGRDQARRPRRPTRQVDDELTDLSDTYGEFATTYTPARFEKEWLRSSLRPFYDERSIVDVLAQVKGGKEANVYRCRAHPALGSGLMAAKVYRPRQFRNLSNDALYREGRTTLAGDGRPIKSNDSRVARALRKKTEFGAEVKHTAWLMHEYAVLTTLHRAGLPVPEPLSVGENAILMSYHGDAQVAAPTLNGVRLEAPIARRLFDELMAAVATMLDNKLIHGDLSAYNILYWEEAVTIIDFPQAVDCHVNPRAFAILQRDIVRLVDYFTGQGVSANPMQLARQLWTDHVAIDIDESELFMPLR